jgi:hypothetical protein
VLLETVVASKPDVYLAVFAIARTYRTVDHEGFDGT